MIQRKATRWFKVMKILFLLSPQQPWQYHVMPPFVWNIFLFAKNPPKHNFGIGTVHTTNCLNRTQHIAPHLLSASACSIFHPPNIHLHCLCLLANEKIRWVGGNLKWTSAKRKYVSVLTHVQSNKGAQVFKSEIWPCFQLLILPFPSLWIYCNHCVC